MREDFLHYIWKYKKIRLNNLETTQGEELVVISVGRHNLNSGPDFFNASIKIGGQLWAGNVEVHVKSSDWFLHNHEQDNAYNNVILHVVWEDDTHIFRSDNSEIPTLQLKDFVDDFIIHNYQKLFSREMRWINCENEFHQTKNIVLNNWLERLYFERLERKSKTIEDLLRKSQNDWEAVLFKMLAKNFGLKVNGESFFSLSQSIDFAIIRKVQSKKIALEALLFGQAKLLDKKFEDAYYNELTKEYKFLTQKFRLENFQVIAPDFFRLRPANFPTIRLSQLASLYHENQNLFSKVMSLNELEDFYSLFNVSAATYWKTHYTFKKVSKPSIKKLSKSFIDLILINTILPLKFCYVRQKGQGMDATIVALASKLKSEKNSIVSAYNDLKIVSDSSLKSQALLQLKAEYCDKNNCLKCAIGNQLLSH
ncbi:DUF2851 family protein [Cognatitamlana onchidii]|uniref:DUF2851 family protein n=1 Tax=Cognatitamlana onchidii TaxID=2562860 RepID=UPI0010A625D4|nr:DUF2851 family protein [Algibacter onchidii]